MVYLKAIVQIKSVKLKEAVTKVRSIYHFRENQPTCQAVGMTISQYLLLRRPHD